ncbi:hypothetical protein GCM10007198_03660 [Microbacterium aerolatum]|uniref:Uncharacterized protein n=2 Tax=Microbacterium aerolatum TaxID=153731 RepID=A0A511ADY5_9MICO|nr:hypothetical protein MAE01_14120 [Microbacterium aerolatum]GGB16333.1 hypothetical protein GCM10007198_03660 [Microbacterium aerolatum]
MMSPNAAKLEALVGAPRRADAPLDEGRDAVRLVAMVEAAAVNSSPTLVSGGFLKNAKQKKVRGYRRIDWLNVGAAAIAIMVAAGAATFTGVQMASASPTQGAVQILRADESALAGAEQAAAASKARLEEAVQTAATDAAALRTALGVLAETEEQPATADSTALATVTQAVDGYTTALGEIVIPEVPAAYKRGKVDTGSLQSVGDAINRVQEASVEVDAVAEQLRAARASVDALTATFTTQLATFATSFAGHAQTEIDEYPVAEQEFRDAVTAAADAITATPLNTPMGATALAAYRDAVIALHDDDYRARLEEEAERESQHQNNWQSPPASEEPTDPGTADPRTTNPGTTNPPPVVDPEPDPETQPEDDDTFF